MSRLLSSLADRRASAAVEFAMVLPVMIFMYLGVVELVQAFQVQKKATQAASSIADLTGQDSSITDAALQGIFTAGEIIMSPFPPEDLRQRISSLVADKDGVVTVEWSVGKGWSGGAPPEAPPGALGPNESLIVADVEYDYDSPVDLVMKGITEIKQTAYFRPRISEKVEKK